MEGRKIIASAESYSAGYLWFVGRQSPTTIQHLRQPGNRGCLCKMVKSSRYQGNPALSHMFMNILANDDDVYTSSHGGSVCAHQ
jgi:hypothetical protein